MAAQQPSRLAASAEPRTKRAIKRQCRSSHCRLPDLEQMEADRVSRPRKERQGPRSSLPPRTRRLGPQRPETGQSQQAVKSVCRGKRWCHFSPDLPDCKGSENRPSLRLLFPVSPLRTLSLIHPPQLADSLPSSALPFMHFFAHSLIQFAHPFTHSRSF